MSKFIENLNAYMNEKRLKQSFLGMVTGMDKTKVSRILTGKQGITETEMQTIAEGLGKSITYFLQDSLAFHEEKKVENTLAFSMGEPDAEVEELATVAFDLLEHFDSILGLENKLNQQILGVAEYGH